MIFASEKKQLNCIQTIKRGDDCDIYICQDEAAEQKPRYTCVLLKNHELIKDFVRICAQSGKDEMDFLVDRCNVYNGHLLVFPWNKERPLADFYAGDVISLEECESICQSLVLACIQSALPFPVLYEVLHQRLLNLNRDNSVYLGYGVDLTYLDESRREADCVLECARILLELLEPKSGEKAISYSLLEKRVASGGYARFTELYKDITISASGGNKVSIVSRIKAFWIRNKDTIFSILLGLCVILTVVALFSLVCQLIFGHVPWIDMLFNNFKQIGTERLDK